MASFIFPELKDSVGALLKDNDYLVLIAILAAGFFLLILHRFY